MKNDLTFKFHIFTQRYVPFAAVAAANCVNIPLMRQNEITNGVDLMDEEGKRLTKSKVKSKHIYYCKLRSIIEIHTIPYHVDGSWLIEQTLSDCSREGHQSSCNLENPHVRSRNV